MKQTTIILLFGIFVINFQTFSHASTTSYYDKAYQLYKKGPSTAQQVIKLLKKELKKNPKNIKASKLLGITLFGTGKMKQAIYQFNKIISSGQGKHIYPPIIFLKTRALFYLGKYRKAKKLLSAHWAFYQNTPQEKHQYNTLLNSINLSIKKISLTEMLQVRMKYANIFSSLLQKKYKQSLKKYIFIIVDKHNSKALSKDSSAKPILSKIENTRPEFWAIIVPMKSKLSPNYYCMYYKSHIGYTVLTSQYKTGRTSLQQQISAITKNYKVETFSKQMIILNIAWRVVTMKTDQNVTLYAFIPQQ